MGRMGCPFSFDDSVMENDNAEDRENSHPNMSEVGTSFHDTFHKRDRGLRGYAFRFSGKCTGFISSASSQHDRKQEFNNKLGDRFLASKEKIDSLRISFLVFSYDENVLLSSSAESCDIHVIGYIQSTKQVYAKSLQKWMGNELEWQLVPGGLCGSPEFTREIQNSGEGRAKHTVYGKLGMNNLGSKKVILFYFLLLSKTI